MDQIDISVRRFKHKLPKLKAEDINLEEFAEKVKGCSHCFHSSEVYRFSAEKDGWFYYIMRSRENISNRYVEFHLYNYQRDNEIEYDHEEYHKILAVLHDLEVII